jgi:hypothetical protein
MSGPFVVTLALLTSTISVFLEHKLARAEATSAGAGIAMQSEQSADLRLSPHWRQAQV